MGGLALTACGADVNVHGKVDTSGTLNVVLDTSKIVAFFRYECPLIVKGTNVKPDTCVTQLTKDLNNFLPEQR